MTQFTVLLVCTGNVCRSPLAEQLLVLELRDVPGVSIHSAGTRALVDAPMMPQSQRIAVRLGAQRSDRVGRQLTDEQIRGADLVLGMAREHRRAVVELVPRASRRTFTIREFARLARAVQDSDLDGPAPLITEDVADRLRAGVDIVASLRGALPPLDRPDDDDVTDPYRQADEVYEASAAELVPAVREVVRLLRRAAFGSSRP